MTTNSNQPTDGRGRAGRGESAGLAERVRLPDQGERAALERVWNGLELPPPSAVPPGFARRVALLAAAPASAGGWWAGRAAGWASAVALAAGIALGALLSSGLAVDGSFDAEAEDDVEESLADASLAAHYLDAVAEEPGTAEAAPEAGAGEAP